MSFSLMRSQRYNRLGSYCFSNKRPMLVVHLYVAVMLRVCLLVSADNGGRRDIRIGCSNWWRRFWLSFVGCSILLFPSSKHIFLIIYHSLRLCRSCSYRNCQFRFLDLRTIPSDKSNMYPILTHFEGLSDVKIGYSLC